MPTMERRTVETILTDPSAPMKMRLELLRDVSRTDEEIAEQILIRLLEAA